MLTQIHLRPCTWSLQRRRPSATCRAAPGPASLLKIRAARSASTQPLGSGWRAPAPRKARPHRPRAAPAGGVSRRACGHTSFGLRPSAWWINDCMRWIEPNYYVALLSAAAHWGSTLRSPGCPGRSVPAPRAITASGSRSRSSRSAPLRRPPRRRFPAASLPGASVPRRPPYSTSFATRIPSAVRAVVRVLVDLAPAITPTDLRAALEALGERSSAQRLGFLLDRAGQERLAEVVATWLGRPRTASRPLEIGIADRKMPEVDRRWHVAFDPARLTLALEALWSPRARSTPGGCRPRGQRRQGRAGLPAVSSA